MINYSIIQKYNNHNTLLTSARPSVCDTCCAKLVLVVIPLLLNTCVPTTLATLVNTSYAAFLTSNFCIAPSISVYIFLKNQYPTKF
jgi:hypothetical protein